MSPFSFDSDSHQERDVADFLRLREPSGENPSPIAFVSESRKERYVAVFLPRRESPIERTPIFFLDNGISLRRATEGERIRLFAEERRGEKIPKQRGTAPFFNCWLTRGA